MNETDHEAFDSMWEAAWNLCGRGKHLDGASINLAFRCLERFDLNDVSRALTVHANDPDVGQYPPKPADIVRIIEGSHSTRAALAWTKVEQAVKRAGPWRDVVFDDAIVHAVLSDMGGWIELNRKTEKEWPFIRREFETRYSGYSQRGERPKGYPKVLRGIANAENDGRFDLEAPFVIGSVEQARLVYQGGGEQGQQSVAQLSDSSVEGR